ncbi:cytochrome c biogenesis CcdA family protein [Paenibacillus sp. NPDC058071]|uniref:cytochrome c biogenesis CcdA family protein n=1 Tax=Paenibacillus sp. NPDC058071 TaxID=3346326 RepID=UPI0036DF189F
MDAILAFAAGLLSFLSPCVMPLIPVYLSYIVGTSVSEVNGNRQGSTVLFRSILFIAGFSLIFIVLGASVSSLSKLLTTNLDIIQKVGGVIIVIFGIHMTGLIKIRFFYADKRLLSKQISGSQASSFLLGMAFAIGWTPCVGPILSSILIYAGSMETIGKGVLLLVFYSLGLALPFFVSALLMGNLRFYLNKINRFLPALSVASGVVMIVMGILVFTNQLEALGQYAGLFNL